YAAWRGSQAGKRKRGIIPTSTPALNAPMTLSSRRIFLQAHPHHTDRKAQALAKLIEKGAQEILARPGVENEDQIAEGARLRKDEAVDVVLEAAFGALEVIGFAGHPGFQMLEQRLADLAATFRAPARLL